MPLIQATLTPFGPLVNVLVGVSIAHAKRMLRGKQVRPRDVAVSALLDTGSDSVVIDHSLVVQLGLLPTGTAAIHTASTFGVPLQGDTYDVSIWINGLPPILMRRTTEVFASGLAPAPYHMILGRSVLDACSLLYDGRNKLCTLDFDIQAP